MTPLRRRRAEGLDDWNTALDSDARVRYRLRDDLPAARRRALTPLSLHED